MIIENKDVSYEEERSKTQDLTFESMKINFARYNEEFSFLEFEKIGLTKDGLYTNLAFILSDQCNHEVKIAAYDNEMCTKFRTRKEFEGSIFKLFEEAINFLQLCNRTASTIKGFLRHDKKDYPEEAIREALLNALIHRDYSSNASIIINVNDNKMEFISIGGLLPGLTKEDILSGISVSRNEKLAAIFYRLRLIEAYGTGLRRIYKFYEEHPIKPEIVITPNVFKIILPNMNSKEKFAENVNKSEKESSIKITSQMKTVIEYLSKHQTLKEETIRELLHIKKTRAYLLTRKMNEIGLIDIVGRGPNKSYKLKDSTFCNHI